MTSIYDSRKPGSWLVLSPQARLRINLRTLNFQDFRPSPPPPKPGPTRKSYPHASSLRTLPERQEPLFACATSRKLLHVKLPPVSRTRRFEQVPTPRGWTPLPND